MTSINLHMRIDNAYIPFYPFRDDCNRFALKPLRWLRFLGYAIYETTDTYLPLQMASMDYESAIGEAHYYFASAGTVFIHVDGGFVLSYTAAPQLLDVRCIDNRTLTRTLKPLKVAQVSC